jgi:hypothetical protein
MKNSSDSTGNRSRDLPAYSDGSTNCSTSYHLILVILCFTLYIFIHSYSKTTFYTDVGISQLFIVSPTCLDTAGQYKGVRYKITSVDIKSLLIRSRKNDTFTDTTIKRYVNRGWHVTKHNCFRTTVIEKGWNWNSVVNVTGTFDW